MAAVTTAIMLFHQSDTPTVLGRYSTTVALALAAMLVITLCAFALSRWLRAQPKSAPAFCIPRFFSQQQNILLFLFALLLFAGGYFFLNDGLLAYAALRLFLALSLLLIYLVGFSSTSGDEQPVLIPRVAIPALLLSAVVAMLFATILPPLLKTDEAFTYSMAVNLRDFGHTAPLVFGDITADSYGWAGLWTRGLSLWLSLLGDGLAQGRWYFMLAGFAAAALTGIATARLYGRAAGWCATAVMAFMILRAGYVRPDLFVSLYLAAALLFYARAHTSSGLLNHLAAGFFVGLAIDAAPIAYLLGVSLALLYLLRTLRGLRTSGICALLPTAALAAGGMLAILIYVWLRQGSGWFIGGQGTPADAYLVQLASRLAAFDLTSLLDLSIFLTAYAPVTGLALLGAAYLSHQQALDRGIMGVVALWPLFMVLLSHYFPVFYAGHGLPLLATLAGVAMARGLAWLMSDERLRVWRVLLLVLAWCGGWLWGVAREGPDLYQLVETGRAIAEELPNGLTIVGAEPYYFGMLKGFRHTYVTGALEQSSLALIGRTPEQTWQAVQPDVLIFSETWATEPARSPALLAYMRENAFQRIACWNTISFGLVEVWGGTRAGRTAYSGECLTVGD